MQKSSRSRWVFPVAGLYLLMASGTASACGQCFDMAVMGVDWWAFPAVAAFCVGLLLEIPVFWMACRLAGQVLTQRRVQSLAMALAVGFACSILTLGSGVGFFAGISMILFAALRRSLRGELSHGPRWRRARLLGLAIFVLAATSTRYPRFVPTPSLLDTYLMLHVGSFSPSGLEAMGWPELEMRTRADAISVVEQRFQLSQTDDMQRIELPNLLKLHYQLNGDAITRQRWCETEKFSASGGRLRGMNTEALDKVCGFGNGALSSPPTAPAGP